MAQMHFIEGFPNFVEKMKEFSPNQDVYVYFSGSKLPNGVSWCDDCVRAWPTISVAIQKFLNPNAHFVYVEVGDRPFWKDPNCVFRLDKSTRLMKLPTIIKWMGPEKLEGEQCESMDLLELLFADE